jgi:hypothetical protein
VNFGQWATALLEFGEWPVTQEKLTGVVAWQVATASPCSCNPLEATEPGAGSCRWGATDLQDYPNVQIGLEAIFSTLHNGRYRNVLAVLTDEGASAYSLAQAVGDSPWGTRNFTVAVDAVRADPAPYFDRPVCGSE